MDTHAFQSRMELFQNKCRRMAKNKLIFLDATGINIGAKPIYGLAPRGKAATVKIQRPKRYQGRVDFIGAIQGYKPIACQVITPTDRHEEGVKGVTKPMMKSFLRETLAPKMDVKGSVVIMDKGLRFKPEEILHELKEGGCQCVAEAWILPTGTGKYLNPLDNNLWHELKDAVRDDTSETENDTVDSLIGHFMAMTEDNIKGHYRNCGLMRQQDDAKMNDEQ